MVRKAMAERRHNGRRPACMDDRMELEDRTLYGQIGYKMPNFTRPERRISRLRKSLMKGCGLFVNRPQEMHFRVAPTVTVRLQFAQKSPFEWLYVNRIEQKQAYDRQLGAGTAP